MKRLLVVFARTIDWLLRSPARLNGVVQQSALTKGKVYDINFMKTVESLPQRKLLLGDRAYCNQALQADLLQKFEV